MRNTVGWICLWVLGLAGLQAAGQLASARLPGKVTDSTRSLSFLRVASTSSQAEAAFVRTFALSPSGIALLAGQETAASGQKAAGPKLTPEQVEALKKENARLESENALITEARDFMNAKQWQQAIDPLTRLVTMEPRWEFYQELGNCQLNLGQYTDAVASYQKGIQAAQAVTAVDPKNPTLNPAKAKAGMAEMLTNQGNALLKLNNYPGAIAAFTRAAELDPNPGAAYFNLCAAQYNTGNTDGAIQACGKAIAADPTRADAYFIKGSALFGNSVVDKQGKFVPPPGAVEALSKYLELAPGGPHAADARQMLEAAGHKIETTYQPKK